jgi:hypothetical protein
MTAHSIVGTGLVVALFVGGCNGDGEATVSTTATTTVAPTTTAAPTTTLDPLAAEEAAVSEAAVQARLARTQAFIDLDDADSIAALDRYYDAGGPARSEVDQSLQDLRDEGWRVRSHPTIPEATTVEMVTFTDGPPPTRAEVIVCIVDSAIIVEPGGGPDGGEAIVNDQVAAARTTYEMVKVDGLWKLRSLIGGQEFEGVAECPAA